MITNSLITGTLSSPSRAFTASITGEEIPTSSRQESAITTMILCNTGVPDITDETINSVDVSIYLVKDGETPDTASFSNMIVNKLTIPAGETVFFSDERIILDGGDSVFVGATVQNQITLTVSTMPV